jgi:hypothetical protein
MADTSITMTINATLTMSPTTDGIPLDIKLARVSLQSTKPSTKLSVGDFELLSVIGRGGYGKVFQVTYWSPASLLIHPTFHYNNHWMIAGTQT